MIVENRSWILMMKSYWANKNDKPDWCQWPLQAKMPLNGDLICLIGLWDCRRVVSACLFVYVFVYVLIIATRNSFIYGFLVLVLHKSVGILGWIFGSILLENENESLPRWSFNHFCHFWISGYPVSLKSFFIICLNMQN